MCLATIQAHLYSHPKNTWRATTLIPIGSMYAIYGNIYHQYTPNVIIYTIHGSYGIHTILLVHKSNDDFLRAPLDHRLTKLRT